MAERPPTRRPPPGWRTWRQAMMHICTGAAAHVAVPTALIVGTILTAVNQGAVIVSADLSPALVARVAANYLVPFVVSSIGYLVAGREPNAPPERQSEPQRKDQP